MRKLKLQMQITIDGYIAGQNDEMDWMIWNWDNALNAFVNSITEPVDTILLGRVLAQGFIPTWTKLLNDPDQGEAARKFVETQKIVFTKSLTEHTWENTNLENGDLKTTVNQLKLEKGGDIIAYGGADFVSNLIASDLIDDYYLFINPVILGKGKTIYSRIKERLNLKLVESKAFECGIVLNHFQKA